ncbi:MAG: molecular chaperone HtpG [Verrucomicrobiota bacterium]
MAQVKTHKFKTEVQHILDLVIHSLYTNKDIFLRELISNASDAIDRARLEALHNKSILEEDPEWKIKLIPDQENRTLTVSDNGIGMNEEELDKNIGTIANSGTQKFLEELKRRGEDSAPELIGEFGVGFYSAFMVADKVTVITRRADETADNAVKWYSEGSGSYKLEPTTKEGRGTDVILHLSEGMDEYLEEWKLRKIVKQYSDFVEYPIAMDVTREEEQEGGEKTEKTEEETLNTQKALWTRPKNQISEEEYNEFYQHVSHDFQEPLKVIHWSAEGKTEFQALLYIPTKAPFDLFTPDTRNQGIHLYVKRIFITDNCEALIPQYLRFLRGVVDSADLPLNVSRETLQEEQLIQLIRKNIIRKVLDTLSQMKEKERENYDSFWNEFGKVLKEGIHLDIENREKLQELALFESSKTESGKYTSLDEYVDNMQEGQKEIYYLAGESRDALENSPLLENFHKHDVEVLFMTDPIDEFVVQSMTSYRDIPVKSIEKSELDLGEKSQEEEKKSKEEAAEEYQQLLNFLKDKLGEKVKDVRVSSRLTDSPCCLVSDEQGTDVHMEKIMQSLNMGMPPSKRILEVNPAHELLQNMNKLVKDSQTEPTLTEYADLLYDQALLTSGLPIDKPIDFSRRISRIMATNAEHIAGSGSKEE